MTPEIEAIRNAKAALEAIHRDWDSIVPQDFALAGVKVLERWARELDKGAAIRLVTEPGLNPGEQRDCLGSSTLSRSAGS